VTSTGNAAIWTWTTDRRREDMVESSLTYVLEATQGGDTDSQS
jgi:hypothetical protein